LHGAFSVTLDRENPPSGQRIFLRGGKLKARARGAEKTLYPYFGKYMLQLFRPMELDKALERMIVLHVAKRSDCLYAWRQNVVVGHSVGVTDQQIAALEPGDIRRIVLAKPSRASFPSRMK
jgi:hypothetical protein